MAESGDHNVKVAVKMENKLPILTELNFALPVSTVVDQLMEAFGEAAQTGDEQQPDFQPFVLVFCDQQPRVAVTDSNKSRIVNGAVLTLEPSAAAMLHQLLHQLQTCASFPSGGLDHVLPLLDELRDEAAFVARIVDSLVAVADQCVQSSADSRLAAALQLLLELLAGRGGWTEWSAQVRKRLISTLVTVVNSRTLKSQSQLDTPLVTMSSWEKRSIRVSTKLSPGHSNHSGGGGASGGGFGDTGTLKRMTMSPAVLAATEERLSRQLMRQQLLTSALGLLALGVGNCGESVVTQVARQVPLTCVMIHVQSDDERVQLAALTLLNHFLRGCDALMRPALVASLTSRSWLTVLQSLVQNHRSPARDRQLHALQLHILSFHVCSSTVPSDADADADTDTVGGEGDAAVPDAGSDGCGGGDLRSRLLQLRRLALCSEPVDTSEPTAVVLGRDLEQLGFSDGAAPLRDLTVASPLLLPPPLPPLLPLDWLLYMAVNHEELFQRLVLDSCRRSERRCPLVPAAVQLSSLLCHLLGVRQPPAANTTGSDVSTRYFPFLFQHKNSLQECFCVAMATLNKTWKDMRATTVDLDKVLLVVREQLVRALSGRHQQPADGSDASCVPLFSLLATDSPRHALLTGPFSPPATFDELRCRLSELSYWRVNNMRRHERQLLAERKLQSTVVLKLRQSLQPELLELVRQQRRQFLSLGTRFRCYSARGHLVKDKFWFMRLSSNRKVLMYGDCDEWSTVSSDKLTSKLAVSEVKQLVTGRDCPHMREIKSKKHTYKLAFSLIKESPEMDSLDVVAPDEKTFNYWTDGLHSLIGEPMTSKDVAADLEKLSSIEIQLRLLNVEGFNILQERPPLPPPPPDYNFCSVQDT